MERKSQSSPARLMAQLGEKVPYINFYRFCQLLEQSQPDRPVVGSTWQVRHEPVRFRPHPGMGFPAGEVKGMEASLHHHLPPTVRITFMGLYGIESPLPTAYLNDLTQRREGYEAVCDFLDIFNHRLIAQVYRIWRKYSWPAVFQAGGKDTTSQYLLCLTGLGIRGCAENIATPVSRFLALSGMMRLPGRSAESITALVRLLAPRTEAEVISHDPLRIPLPRPLVMETRAPVSMACRPIMGSSATDVNSQVLLKLSTLCREDAQAWLPGGQLCADLLALLHVYLGARLHVRLQLKVPRALLPDALLSCRPRDSGIRLGHTAAMRRRNVNRPLDAEESVTISLGRYQRAQINFHRRKTDESGDYRW